MHYIQGDYYITLTAFVHFLQWQSSQTNQKALNMLTEVAISSLYARAALIFDVPVDKLS